VAQTRLTRQQQKDQTRERLLEAAAKSFEKHGYNEVSVEQIAESAGYTIGALYAHFDGKADLFMSIVEQRIDRHLGTLRGLRDVVDPRERQEIAGRELRALSKREATIFTLLIDFGSQVVRDPKIRRRFAKRYEEIRAVIGEIIADQLEQMNIESPIPTEQLASATLALGDGSLVQRLIDPDRPDVFAPSLGLLFAGVASLAGHESGNGKRSDK
jgi:AcrR family transcriptional regulator